MKRDMLKIILFFGMVFFSVGRHNARGGQPWRLETRLQTLYENDSNVRESLHHPQAAHSTRFLVNPVIQKKGKRLDLFLQYHGGLQLYQTIGGENKLVNEINARVSWRFGSNFAMGLKGFGRLKLFLNRDTDYLWDRTGPYIAWHGGRHGVQLNYTAEGVDYARIDYFDSHSDYYALNYYYNLRPNFQISPSFTFGLAATNRPAYDFVADLFNWLRKDEQQQDQIRIYALQLDWLWRGLLLNAHYGFEDLESNSYGFGYSKHYITFMTAKNVEGVLLRIYATLQKKNYHDDVRPLWPLELDTEKEESNFFVFDVSRDLSAHTLLMLRLAYYRNESPWANIYYEKFLLHLGFEFRF